MFSYSSELNKCLQLVSGPLLSAKNSYMLLQEMRGEFLGLV